MNADAHLAVLRADGVALADHSEAALDAPVPTCPDWHVAALVAHLGGVHRWVTSILATGTAPGRRTEQAYPARSELIAWYREGLGVLLAELASGDPDAPAWTRAGERTRWWWARRMSAETAVHRYDAEVAVSATTASTPTPIDREIAVDGIDEHLTEFLPGRVLRSRRDPARQVTGSLHLHATDGPGEWWIDLDAESPQLQLQHAKADSAVRGPASYLLLWLWGRIPANAGGLELFGRTETIERIGRLDI